jgi:hypothetical protein
MGPFVLPVPYKTNVKNLIFGPEETLCGMVKNNFFINFFCGKKGEMESAKRFSFYKNWGKKKSLWLFSLAALRYNEGRSLFDEDFLHQDVGNLPDKINTGRGNGDEKIS